jgi:hypothetical protein
MKGRYQSVAPQDAVTLLNHVSKELDSVLRERNNILASEAYLVGRSIISMCKLDFRGAIRSLTRLRHRRADTVTSPNMYRLANPDTRRLLEVEIRNPSIKAIWLTQILVIGRSLECDQFQEIEVLRGNAERVVSEHPWRDLVVNTNGFDGEWGSILSPSNMQLVRFFSKLLSLCEVKGCRVHLIANGAPGLELKSRFEGRVSVHATVLDYVQWRDQA